MPRADVGEAELLGRAKIGDHTAFGALVRLHQSNVRNQLRRLTKGDVELADDLAQDSFVQAWSSLASFRGEARLSTWLYSIAYSRFLMHQRKRQELPLIDSDVEPTNEASTPANGNLEAMKQDVARALERLPEAERLAIVHCYHLDLSHQEAAAVLQMPLGSLKTCVERGKARLRGLLADWAKEVT
jgi:RNA polymerase sigma-70 factor (ECF subfamily)